jgi:hypothetical protein
LSGPYFVVKVKKSACGHRERAQDTQYKSVGRRCRAGARRFYIGYNNISAGCLLFVFHHTADLAIGDKKKNCVSNNYHMREALRRSAQEMQRE